MTQQHSLFEQEVPTTAPAPVTKVPKLKVVAVEKCDFCSKEYDYGCHGVRNGEGYTIRYCEKHYFAMTKGKGKADGKESS